MVKIKAFRAIRYNDSLRDSIKYLVSPPYDTYESGDDSDNKQKSVKANFSYIKKPLGNDNEKYVNARNKLEELLRNDILILEDEESMYVYEQTFLGKKVLGFISALKLEDYSTGKVLRHEMTKLKSIDDRAKLLEALAVNTGIIYTLFSDTDNIVLSVLKSVENSAPLFDFVDDAGVGNRVWKINGEICEELRKAMFDKTLFVADGHHRYETAINYAKKFDSTLKKDLSTNYILTYAVPDDLSIILPYNRVIFVDETLYANFLGIMGRNFEILEKPSSEIYTPIKPHRIIVYYDRKVYEIFPKKIPESAVGSLDVSMLQDKLFLHLGFSDEKLRAGDGIIYLKGDAPLHSIKEIVDKHQYAIGFSLHPVSVKQLEAVALDYRKDSKTTKKVMPPKSTFFYPKPYSGIVSYKF